MEQSITISTLAGILFCLIILGAIMYKLGLFSAMKVLQTHIVNIELPQWRFHSGQLKGHVPFIVMTIIACAFAILFFVNNSTAFEQDSTPLHSFPCKAKVVGDIELLRVMWNPHASDIDYLGSIPLGANPTVTEGPIKGLDDQTYYKVYYDLSGYSLGKYLSIEDEDDFPFGVVGHVTTQEDPLGVRSSPNSFVKNFLGSIPRGSKVDIRSSKTGSGEETWYFVEYRLTGYVDGRYLWFQ